MVEKKNVEKKYIKVEIDKLKDYWKNNKIHTDYDIWEIVKSIQKSEYLSPIIIDENFEIINGHGRKEALKQLWHKQIEVLQVFWLTAKQKKTARLLDNKVNTLSQFDVENIKMELDELWDEEINDLFSDLILDKVDYDKIYEWMPEYNQEDLSGEYSIKVNLKELKDVEEFGKRIGQKLTEKTRSIWFPANAKSDTVTQMIDE